MIAIVDYGVGNLFSLRCSLEYLGIDCTITAGADEIRRADRVILPGVGAFGDAAEKLRDSGLAEVVLDAAGAGKPLLGICLGMQLLYESSCEYGTHKGLGLVPGEIGSLRDSLGDQSLKVPHMGWNSLETPAPGHCALLADAGDSPYVYFVHSFYAPVTGDTAAFATYGDVRVTAVVQRDNVYGTQFHPEKSGAVGLAMLKAFAQA